MSRRDLRCATAGLALCGMFFGTALVRAEEDPSPWSPIPGLDADAAALFGTLSAAQREKAVLPFDSPERNQEVFPGGKRAGIPLGELDEAQRAAAMKLIAGFTSDYGAKKCEAVSAQDKDGGLNKYYLAFFGAPGPGASYAWRIAEHHLTLVHVEVERGTAARVGPILLGANPPVLWDAEEDALIALYAALTPDDRRKVGRTGKAISKDPIGDAGAPLGELSPDAREKAKAVFEGRLSFFAPQIQARIRALVEKQGGLAGMRVAYWGEATKRCAEGGLWDFKLGGPAFLCDYENTRGHIHMSMKGSLESSRK